MPQLPNFPMDNQLDSSDPDAQYMCIPTVIAASIQYVTGKPVTGTWLKEQIYGVAYTGMTNVEAFLKLAEQLGVQIIEIDGDPNPLIAQIRAHLQANQPVMMLEKDPYADPSLGWAHAITFYGWDANSLTALDPWGGKSITSDNGTWSALMMYNAIWVVAPIPAPAPPPSPTPAPLTFNADDVQVWHLEKSDIAINQAAAIEQSWLRARWLHGWNFGPPLENEHDVERNGQKYTEQQFGAARASYSVQTGQLWWFTSTGPVQV